MEQRKYRPSNGTEGEIFQSRYCNNCIHDDANNYREQGEKFCDIITMSMAFEVTAPEYPVEWIYENGQPTCTKFERYKPTLKIRWKDFINAIRYFYRWRVRYKFYNNRFTEWKADQKMKIAERAFEKYPDSCWADWVSWASHSKRITGRTYKETTEPATGCMSEGESGSCYCGRFNNSK